MTEQQQPLKATIKGGQGYDAPWITVDATDPNDLAQKARGLVEHPDAIQAVVELANIFKGANNAAPLLPGGQDEPVQQAPAPQQQAPSNPWGGQPQQQQAAPQQAQPQQQNRFGGPQHPEGKTCDICPKVLEEKKTSSGKLVWRCPDWRWGNGNPNGHTNIFR